ncbi:MAG: hypothetical protein IJH25_11315 [Clostridia bacterium]|nr:hypothetical protein [Clostridia bacterium]
MNERNIRVLEFPKILEMLAALAVTDPGREAARALMPSGDAATVRRWQAETEEATTVMAYTGGNPMAYFTDVRPFLKLAKAGAPSRPRPFCRWRTR